MEFFMTNISRTSMEIFMNVREKFHEIFVEINGIPWNFMKCFMESHGLP